MITAATANPVAGEDRPILHLVRIVLEASSPLSVGGGEDSSIFDTALLRDANGLPTIQGASLAGNLRHRLSDDLEGLELARELFGFEEEGEAKGSPAKLTFSFGSVLDSAGIAVQGLRHTNSDEVLAILLQGAPLRRDHVAIDRRGVAGDHTKYDRIAVPKGTRFAFELAMWGVAHAREADKTKLGRLVGIMNDPAFRLGGATRRGYGQIKIERAHWRTIDIAEGPAVVREVRQAGPSNVDGFSVMALIKPESAMSACSGTIVLRPVGVWRIGQGDVALSPRTNSDSYKQADALPLTEPVIVWENGKGCVRAAAAEVGDPGYVRLSVPASAIKGPLAHRALYHYLRIDGPMIEFDKADKATNPEFDGVEGHRAISAKMDALFGREALTPLLGNAKSRDAGGGRDDVGDRGRAGLLLINDSEVRVSRSTQIVHIMHNSIDRFTGGVRSGLLFSEEVVLGGALRIDFRLLKGEVPPDVKQAFCLALKDLCEGRIAIGAKRLGFAEGYVEWHDTSWLTGIDAAELPPQQARTASEAAE